MRSTFQLMFWAKREGLEGCFQYVYTYIPKGRKYIIIIL